MLGLKSTPDQSWVNPNQTDPFVTLCKSAPGGSKKELLTAGCWVIIAVMVMIIIAS